MNETENIDVESIEASLEKAKDLAKARDYVGAIAYTGQLLGQLEDVSEDRSAGRRTVKELKIDILTVEVEALLRKYRDLINDKKKESLEEAEKAIQTRLKDLKNLGINVDKFEENFDLFKVDAIKVKTQ